MTTNYSQATELAGDGISQEQINRMVQRYVWALSYFKDYRFEPKFFGGTSTEAIKP